MTKRTGIRPPAELLKKAKREVDTEGRTLTAPMEDGLRYAASDKPAGGKAARPEIPVSKATGGLMPGITNPWRDTEEMDDLEYIERLKPGFR